MSAFIRNFVTTFTLAYMASQSPPRRIQLLNRKFFFLYVTLFITSIKMYGFSLLLQLLRHIRIVIPLWFSFHVCVQSEKRLRFHFNYISELRKWIQTWQKKMLIFFSVVLKIRFGYWKNIDPISVITYSHTICCKFSLTVNWSRTSFSFNFHFTREYWIWCLSNVEREKKVNVRHVVFALTCSVQIYTFYFPFPFVIKTKSHL